VYVAMVARGYAGTMPRLSVLAFRRADAVFLGALVLTLVPLRVLAEVAS
jgi:energy-coupling factor transporter transmembrane protein EcfT